MLKNCVRVCIIILLSISNSLNSAENDFEFQFFRYPKIFKINSNIKVDDLHLTVNCYFEYTGSFPIICTGWVGYDAYTFGDVVFLDKHDKIIPESAKYIKIRKHSLEAAMIKDAKDAIDIFIFMGTQTMDDTMVVPFAWDAIYSTQFILFDRGELEKSGMANEIKKKNLRKIKIKIDKILINWEKDRQGTIIQGYPKKLYTINVNREIEIRVEYEDNKSKKRKAKDKR
jgi:hypothetical protein